MKALTILLGLLLLAGIATAETYNICMSGANSYGFADQDTVFQTIFYRDSMTIEVINVAEMVGQSRLDEFGPGSHNEVANFMAQHATPADYYLNCIGCKECLQPENHRFDVPIRGTSVGGSWPEFVREVKNLSNLRKHVFWDANEPREIPRWQPFREGDIVYIWMWGTGGRVWVNGIEKPCYFTAFGGENCLELGGIPILPSDMRGLIETIRGGAEIHIEMNFAYAAAFADSMGYIPNVHTWAGVGPEELCYIVQTGEYSVYMWNGYNIGECYFPETHGHQAMCLYLHHTNGTYEPWDREPFDYRLYLTEATLTLTERCANNTSYCFGDDCLLYIYDDEQPRGGDNIRIGISPNPFNPTTTINFALTQRTFVNLAVYNILGKKLMQLENGYLEAGQHRISFNGSHLSSGTYFVHGSFGLSPVTRKMQLVK